MVSAGLSQGFDWQYSYRMPFETPDFFIGVPFNYEYTQIDADLPIRQDDYKPCCHFSKGTGNNINFGLAAEYWGTGDLAYTFIAGFNMMTANFSTLSEPIAMKGGLLKFNNKVSSQLYYLSLGLGAKYRLFGSHFNLGILLNTYILMNQSYTHTEDAVNPPPDYNAETHINYTTTSYSQINRFYFMPALRLGYDFSPWIGLYFSPYINLNIPVMNITSNYTWRPWGLSAGISLFFGSFRSQPVR